MVLTKLLLFCLLVVSTSVWAEVIFVKYKDQPDVIVNFAKKEKIVFEKKYDSLRLLKFKASISDPCQKLVHHPLVVYCEKNAKISLDNDVECKDPDRQELSIHKAADFIAGCQILPNQINHAPIKENLSPLWAQEYTGADIVRKNLQELGLAHTIEIEIIDTSFRDHGSRVANLMAGPHPTALLPASSTPTMHETNNSADLLENYTSLTSREGSPKYVNMSLSWESSEVVKDALDGIVNNGIVLVSSAGNRGYFININEMSNYLGPKSIIVGSTSYDGSISKFSQQGAEVDISAPSNSEIMSYGSNGPSPFSGTSGAAPQITASLASFTLLTGHALTNNQAEKLLNRTSIKLGHHLIDPQVHGRGSLNAFKIFEVAKRLKILCPKDIHQAKCMEEKLNLDSTYHFDFKPIKGLERAFPMCFDSKKKSKIPSCEERQKLLTLLRQQAFLNQNDSNLWEQVACLHRLQGLSLNADYYQTLSESTDLKRYSETFPDRLKRGFYNPAVDYRIFHDWLEQKPEIVESIPFENRDEVFLSYMEKIGVTPERLNYFIEHSPKGNSPSSFDEGAMKMITRNPAFFRHPRLVISLIDKNSFKLDTWLKEVDDYNWRQNPKALAHLLQKCLDTKATTAQLNKAISLTQKSYFNGNPDISGVQKELIKQRDRQLSQ